MANELISSELRQHLHQAAAEMATWPVNRRAWWIVYLLEGLEELTGAEETRTILEAVKLDIETRLIAGRW